MSPLLKKVSKLLNGLVGFELTSTKLARAFCDPPGLKMNRSLGYGFTETNHFVQRAFSWNVMSDLVELEKVNGMWRNELGLFIETRLPL